MISKILKIICLIFFWLLVVFFETSFLKGFSLTLFLVILINLIEDGESNLGIISAFFAGLLLDLNNTTYIFSFFTLSLIVFSLTSKIILIKFLKIPYVSWLPKI